mmetsp:Transcript_41293/g.106853  ORF Transcript_41293/g.106853 Transcript_41293/m.106853 type:complete len:271 (-) Transcript_41293:477-1289(-)
MRIWRSSIAEATDRSPSVRGIRCTLSSSRPMAVRAPRSRHVENLFSLRKIAVIRRGMPATSSRPSADRPSSLELRCSASKLGSETMARFSTRQSATPLPSSTIDFSFGIGCRSKPESSGTPSERPLCARCKCSRRGKTCSSSKARRVSQVTLEPLSTSVRTLHWKGSRTILALTVSAGRPLGSGSRQEPSATGLRRVLDSDSHSRFGQSSQIAATSAHSVMRHLSSHRLFRFGRDQSPCQTSSGYRSSIEVSASDISTKPSSRCWRCSQL